ncbi:MAG: hypothetical protein FWD61_14090 [Phycisphaerales bacterium]|nr:hypothetical protein [Phycisphaerales bacterium]
MSEENTTNSILEEILPTQPLTHASVGAPPLNEFLPWHLPRKHHVRKKQWGEALEELIDKLPDRQLINYLCLPGEDLLDVQVFAEVCRRKSRRLRYLGFNTAQSKESSIQRIAAEQQLRQTDVVEDNSEVVPDGFSSIACQNSIGRRYMRDRGSYDVVNLDMCDSFTTHPHAHNHDAVLELLNHQSHWRGEPWLLFLTTHTKLNRLQQKELEIYDRTIEENARQSAVFCESLGRMVAASDCSNADVVLSLLNQMRKDDTNLSGRWLTLAVGKWLLGIMADGAPWRVDILSVYCYRTGLLSEHGGRYASDPPNLFSIVFQLQKIQRSKTDPTGLASPTTIDGMFDEKKLAEKMAFCVEKRTIDLDCHLQANPSVATELATECESLLGVRYYDREAYRSWVGRLPVIPC